MLLSREITLQPGPQGPEPVALFDLADTQVLALSEALGHLRRVRYLGSELDTDGVLALRALTSQCDTFEQYAALGVHCTVRATGEEAARISDATAFYLAERDVESYQSPEERARIAALHTLTEPLRDLSRELRLAATELAEHPERYERHPALSF